MGQCALLLLVLLSASAPVQAQDVQRQVLTLYSTRRDAKIVDVGDRELPKILEQSLGTAVDYYSEFIDQARFAQPDYHDAVRSFLRVKYRTQDFDLLIVIGDTSLGFISESRAELFPNTPIVYFSERPAAERPLHATGIIAPLNLDGTLDFVSTLQPEARHVYVISGAAQNNANFLAAARQQFGRFAGRFDITFLSGLPARELETRLAALPERSVVYYLAVDRDANDQNFQPLDYLQRVVAVSRAPVYSWVDSTLGRGVVGGSLKSQSAEMEAVGDLAVRVLNGESPDTIPLASPDLNIRQVDWRQMRRWGISEGRLPQGTLVQFRDPGIWERYKAYIIAAFVLLIGQSALIMGLLVQGSRRRQAESGLRASQDKLRASYNTISDLSGRLLLAQEAERAHLARELHDDVGQQIALLVTDLQRLSGIGREARRDPEQAVNVALDHAFSLSKSVHDLSHRLHPAKLRMLGLPAALDGLQHEFSRPGLSVGVTYDNVPSALDQNVTLCVFRVIQEALQNAIKHSGAKEVMVHLSGSDDKLTVTVIDDGTGFDVQSRFGSGLGLISMKERLEALGGTLTIRSAPRTGTRLKIQVPFDAARMAKPIAV
jgi:signal transduction histidine kinase